MSDWERCLECADVCGSDSGFGGVLSLALLAGLVLALLAGWPFLVLGAVIVAVWQLVGKFSRHAELPTLTGFVLKIGSVYAVLWATMLAFPNGLTPWYLRNLNTASKYVQPPQMGMSNQSKAIGLAHAADVPRRPVHAIAPFNRGDEVKRQPTVMVPRVAWLKYEQAKRVLTEAGLRIGQVKREDSWDTDKGRALRTEPDSGAMVPIGTTVDLVMNESSEDRSPAGLWVDESDKKIYWEPVVPVEVTPPSSSRPSRRQAVPPPPVLRPSPSRTSRRQALPPLPPDLPPSPSRPSHQQALPPPPPVPPPPPRR